MTDSSALAGLKPYDGYKDSDTPGISNVPEHWEVTTLGRIGRFFKGNGSTKADEVSNGVPCVRYGDLYTRHEFFIHRSRSFVTQERRADYTPILYGDVLFAASGETIEDIGRSAVNLISSEACCGGDVLVFRLRRELVPRFIGYLSDCPSSRYQKACMGRGFTVIHIYADQLKSLRVAIPPLAEQSAIVRFLDHTDRRIRRYILAKQKLIKLLEEQKQTVIHSAVTRGLNANVRLKSSGLEWLGDVPEHWQIVRIKHVARMESGHTPSRSVAEYWLDTNDIPWVSLNDTKQLSRVDYISDTAFCVNELGLANSSARLLPGGAVVFTRDAAVGKAAITTRPMAVSQHLIAWLCGPRLLNGYLLKVFYAMKEELSRHTFGATIATIGMDDVRKLVTPLPPLGEQKHIVEHINEACRVIDQNLNETRQLIKIANEYRTRLIADVVTGKLDVRETAANLPDEADEPDVLPLADALGGADDLEVTSEAIAEEVIT